jgi:CDP-diacylglycerol---glycerol-3-phosphate 3-phosphatidyltransferase
MAWVNAPNLITLGRIVLAIAVVPLLLTDDFTARIVAFVLFLVAAFSDLWDGHLARTQNLVTDFGKLMDPLADKLLIIAALVSLVSLNRLPAWVAMVIIARELAVTALRSIAAERGVVISASWMGKVKTVLQIGAVFALIAFNPAPLAVDLLVYAAVAATVLSGLDYFFGIRRRMEEQRRISAEGKPRDLVPDSPAADGDPAA